MTHILHIDTSGSTGLVAVSKDETTLSKVTESETRNHASTINLYINEALDKAGISMTDLDAVSVCGGPGSYTGLRIGLATAKGICYILDKPLLMHNKLTLLAASVSNPDKKNIISLLQARENEYFCAVYDMEIQELLAPKHYHVDELQKVLAPYKSSALFTGIKDAITNTLANEQNSEIIEAFDPDLDSWSRYAKQLFDCNDFVNLAYAEPFYLKQVYTHKPKNSK